MQKQHTTPSDAEREQAETEYLELHNFLLGMSKLFHTYMSHDDVMRTFHKDLAPPPFEVRMNKYEVEAVTNTFIKALDRSYNIAEDYLSS